MPPSGRTTKPTPKVRNASMVPTSGSPFGKNNSPNTSADAVPYRKKSYHSSADPMQAAKITRSCGALADEISVIVPPGRFSCHCFCVVRSLIAKRKAPASTAGAFRRSGCPGEVGLLRGRLRLVDRALLLGWGQRHPHRHVRQPRSDHDVAREQATVEFVEVLHAHQRPGVAGGDFIEQ